MTRSSGRLSRCRLRVRIPQSPLFTLPRFEKSHPVPLLMGASISMVLLKPFGVGVGDCASGVAQLLKLETETGDSSTERLRLKPIVDNVICGWDI